MRIRSYYSDSEIIPNLYTFGKEWQLTDGSEYKGLYHKYKSTGEIYTEAVWNQRSSVSLSEYKELSASIKLYRKLKSDIQIGTTIGAIIVTEESIIPAPVIIPDTKYTVTSIAVILLRYFFFVIAYSSVSVLSFIEHSLTVS